MPHEVSGAKATNNERLPSPAGSETYPQRRYGHYTLPEWQTRLKYLDPQSPDAAAAVAGLIEIINDDDVAPFTRRQAALTLGRIGEAAVEAVPHLVALMTDESADEATIVWSIKALSLMGPAAHASTPALISTLENQRSPLVARQACFEALGRIGVAHPDVLPALIQVLSGARKIRNDETTALRGGAADAVSLIGPSASPVVPALIRATVDPNETVRRKVFEALESMGGRADVAVPAMVEALMFDESAAVRDAAEAALATAGPDATLALRKLSTTDDPELRLRAVRGLRQMGVAARPAEKDLWAALQDADEKVRIEAAQALSNISATPQQIVPVLVECLTSRQRTVRLRAHRQLVGMGEAAQAAIGQLEQLANHERADVRRLAAETLRKIRDAAAPAE